MTRLLFISFSILITVFIPQLQALQCPFDVAISGGYRRDSLSTLEIEPSQPADFINTHIDANKMDVWQYGIKARSTLAGMLFYQQGFAMEHVYLRGSAYQGWIKNGHLRNLSLPPSGSSSSGDIAFLHNGRTLDADIAIGITLLPVDCWITVAPVGGYSYDKQKVVNHPNNRTRATYTTKWKGPFAGGDIAFDFGSFRIRGGYEYHWAYWTNDTDIKFKVRRHHRSSLSSSSSDSSGSFQPPGTPQFQAIGRVAFVDLRFYVCQGFDLGLGVKYQIWHTRKSKHQFSSANIFGRAHWRSLGITGELVYRF